MNVGTIKGFARGMKVFLRGSLGNEVIFKAFAGECSYEQGVRWGMKV